MKKKKILTPLQKVFWKPTGFLNEDFTIVMNVIHLETKFKKNKIFSDTSIKQIAKHVLEEIKKNNCEISIHLIEGKKIKKLNFLYRGINKKTDVLSFPIQDNKNKYFPKLALGKLELGDIFISPEVIIRQAETLGISAKNEFIRMVVHGILHLTGFDHKKKKEAEQMFFLQEKVVSEVSKKI